MATIVEVAKMAGVSPSLVSRYLNGVPGVGEKNREKIRRAIAESGYRRNELARSLVRTRTRAIGVVIGTMESSFYRPLVDGLIEAADAADYMVVFGVSRDAEPLRNRIARYFTSNMVDGVILYGSNLVEREMIRRLSASAYPLVLIENDEPGANVDKVLIDGRGALRELTLHLLNEGLTDLRFVPWGYGQRAGEERAAGFCDAMRERGLFDEKRCLPLNDSPAFRRGWTMEALGAYLDDLYERDDLPEAFVCGADEVSRDLLVHLRELGVDVPGRVRLAGFDGENFGLKHFGYPELTTMAQPLFEIGAAAVELLVKRLADPDRPRETRRFQAALRLGGTT